MAIKKPWQRPQCRHISKIYGMNGHLGNQRLGHLCLGYENEPAGIYQRKYQFGKPITSREKFYMQNKPRTANQNAAAATFAAGMAAWALLTDDQKEVYNNKAKKYRIEGVNLFMREYMLSH